MIYKFRRLLRQVFLWGVGIVFLVMTFIGGYMYLRDSNFVRQATVTSAIVTEKYTQPNPNDSSDPDLYVRYEFSLPDNTVISDETTVSYNEYTSVYAIGRQYEVHYDADNPSRHLFDVERSFPNRLNSLLLIFGISLVGLIFGGVDLLWKRGMGTQSRKK
ncbi:MAG: DUF3592 domain-containing protein [Chloroflexota bacterium]